MKLGSWLLAIGGFLVAMGLSVVVTLVVVGKLNVKGWWEQLGGSVSYVFEGSDKKAEGGVSEYAAVFLANGQVYFGKLSGEMSQYPILRDVFYLRIQRQLQPPDEETSKGEGGERRETQLIKLGEELHGPVDEIRFNRDQILFIEKMKHDSRVVQGIKQYYEQKK